MSSETLKRDFKGIWIPKEIWLDSSLSINEKVLLAEIHSLCGDDGCFASNEYLCNFFGWKERQLREYISRLRNMGYIHVHSFDGRTRVLKMGADPKYVKEKIEGADRRNLRPAENRHPEQREPAVHPYSSERKEDNKDNIPPICPPLFFPREAVRMLKSDHDALVSKFGPAEVDYTIEQLSLYAKIDPDKFKRYKNHASVVQAWILKERKKEEKWKTKTKQQPKSTNSSPDSSVNASRELRLVTPSSMKEMLKNYFPGSKETKDS